MLLERNAKNAIFKFSVGWIDISGRRNGKWSLDATKFTLDWIAQRVHVWVGLIPISLNCEHSVIDTDIKVAALDCWGTETDIVTLLRNLSWRNVLLPPGRSQWTWKSVEPSTKSTERSGENSRTPWPGDRCWSAEGFAALLNEVNRYTQLRNSVPVFYLPNSWRHQWWIHTVEWVK